MIERNRRQEPTRGFKNLPFIRGISSLLFKRFGKQAVHDQRVNRKTLMHTEEDAGATLETPDARLQRVKSQRAVEENLHDFYSLPFVERVKKMRHALFDEISDVDQMAVSETRKTAIDSSIVYLNGGQVEEYTSQLGVFVDNLHKEIGSLPAEQREEAAIRLNTIIYALGIAIHPYFRGNLQTLKMVMLTYLHELGGDQVKNFYYRYRLENDSSDSPTPFSNFHTAVMGPAQENNLISGYFPRARSEQLQLLQQDLGDQVALERDFPDHEERTDLQSELSGWQVQQAEVEERIRSSQLGGSREINLAGYLDYVLFTPRGREFLSRYVLLKTQYAQETVRIDPSFIGYERSNLPVYFDLKREIQDGLDGKKSILESKETHEESFASQTRYLL